MRADQRLPPLLHHRIHRVVNYLFNGDGVRRLGQILRRNHRFLPAVLLPLAGGGSIFLRLSGGFLVKARRLFPPGLFRLRLFLSSHLR